MKLIKGLLTIMLSLTAIYRVWAQAPLPSADLTALDKLIQRNFGTVDNIRTIGMSDVANSRFDVVVVGRSTGRQGWRVNAFSIRHHKVEVIFDSMESARRPEFSNSGPKAVSLNMQDYDYTMVIEGCAPHLCNEGVSGFLLFSGKTRQVVTAKVINRELTSSAKSEAEYEVTFSDNADKHSKEILQDAICQSSALGSKTRFPFTCSIR